MQMMESFDMDFSWYTQDKLMNEAFDNKALAQMDRGDMLSMIRELALRLQRANDELQVLAR
jgi:hypothetical protein